MGPETAADAFYRASPKKPSGHLFTSGGTYIDLSTIRVMYPNQAGGWYIRYHNEREGDSWPDKTGSEIMKALKMYHGQ